jgi:hypothetical protein
LKVRSRFVATQDGSFSNAATDRVLSRRRPVMREAAGATVNRIESVLRVRCKTTQALLVEPGSVGVPRVDRFVLCRDRGSSASHAPRLGRWVSTRRTATRKETITCSLAGRRAMEARLTHESVDRFRRAARRRSWGCLSLRRFAPAQRVEERFRLAPGPRAVDPPPIPPGRFHRVDRMLGSRASGLSWFPRAPWHSGRSRIFRCVELGFRASLPLAVRPAASHTGQRDRPILPWVFILLQGFGRRSCASSGPRWWPCATIASPCARLRGPIRSWVCGAPCRGQTCRSFASLPARVHFPQG